MWQSCELSSPVAAGQRLERAVAAESCMNVRREMAICVRILGTASVAGVDVNIHLLRYNGDQAGRSAFSEWPHPSTNNLQAAKVATNSGKRLLGAGDLDGAISQFRSAIHSEPNYAAAHYELGLALQQSGKKDESEKEFQRAAELDPHLAAPGK